MRTVVVTGGLGDIGRAIVRTLQASAQVIIIDYLPPDDHRVLDAVNHGAVYIKANIVDAVQVVDAFNQMQKLLDENQLTLYALINNAGITRDNLLLRMTEEQWDAVLDVNLKGAFLCSQQALKRMIRQEKSYIVNISSVVGLYGNAGQANYAASKAGLIALTQTLAKEYAQRGVRVNAVAPGCIMTAMTEKLDNEYLERILNRIALHEFGKPGDVAQLVDFLISGKADYITGQVITLDGGMY